MKYYSKMIYWSEIRQEYWLNDQHCREPDLSVREECSNHLLLWMIKSHKTINSSPDPKASCSKVWFIWLNILLSWEKLVIGKLIIYLIFGSIPCLKKENWWNYVWPQQTNCKWENICVVENTTLRFEITIKIIPRKWNIKWVIWERHLSFW